MVFAFVVRVTFLLLALETLGFRNSPYSPFYLSGECSPSPLPSSSLSTIQHVDVSTAQATFVDCSSYYAGSGYRDNYLFHLHNTGASAAVDVRFEGINITGKGVWYSPYNSVEDIPFGKKVTLTFSTFRFAGCVYEGGQGAAVYIEHYSSDDAEFIFDYCTFDSCSCFYHPPFHPLPSFFLFFFFFFFFLFFLFLIIFFYLFLFFFYLFTFSFLHIFLFFFFFSTFFHIFPHIINI
jgi:hypothetical protein